MKTILCYGDSNTWGYNASTGGRFPPDARWTGRLQSLLGSDYRVIEEGQCGRTTVWDDPIEGSRNGYKYLLPCLESHSPLDFVILMLGTNDTKHRFSLSAFEIAQGAAVLVRGILTHPIESQPTPPKVLLVSPAPIRPEIEHTAMGDIFGGMRSREISLKFPEYFRRVAEENKCLFLDAADVIEIDKLDAVHLSKDDHEKFARACGRIILDTFRG